MRKIKCSILLSILCVASLLMNALNVENTSALKISNLRNMYIQYIDFNQYSPSATYTSVALKNFISTPLYSATVQPDNTLRLSSLVIRLQNTVNYKKDDEWDLTLYTYTFLDSYRGLNGETLIPTALCPTFSSGGNLIDECNIEYHDMIDSPIDLTNLGAEGQVVADYAVQNKIHGYYAIKLKGHFTSDGSGNAMNLSAPFIGIYNPTSQALPIQYLIAFSPLKIYTPVPDDDAAAEELNEMNQKDDQDRADLETQSSNTDSGAEDSADDFGAATTNISGVISTFISNLNNLNANNCTLPEISAYGFSIGRMNLCTYSPPNWIQGVTTAIISLITLRLAWHLFKRIMGIAKGLAGSK